MVKKVVIIGAGISGLSAAYFLTKKGFDVLVLEKGEKVGGKIQTERVDGDLFELGPNSLRGYSGALKELIADLQFEPNLLYASSDKNKRFINLDGELQPLPTSFLSFLTNPILSLKQKLRLFKEPFVKAEAVENESLASFFKRRFGREMAEYLLDPFISGIYAGDIDRLEARQVFPELVDYESRYGSVLRGFLKASKTGKKNRDIFTFQDGLGSFLQAIAKKLDNRILLNSAVKKINEQKVGYQLVLESGKKIIADYVVMATPAYTSAELVQPLHANLAEKLASVSYPRVDVLHVLFDTNLLEQRYAGFGFLNPSSEQKSYLGCIYQTSLYKRSEKTHFTVLIGGAHHSDQSDQYFEHLRHATLLELKADLKIESTPLLVKTYSWAQAIPQYDRFQREAAEAITTFHGEQQNLFFIGNYYQGISAIDCIENGKKLAERLLEQQ
jgi:oxygen-dependent protoporphyrinogen oxidase